jgi:hypothetical protein
MRILQIERPSLWLAGVCLVLFAGAPRLGLAAAERALALPAYHADLSQTSVSGLSSGAYMAGQFAVAYSAMVVGAGLIAGGPYYCAGSPSFGLYTPYMINAMSSCMNPQQALAAPPVAFESLRAAKSFAQSGRIDDPARLKRQKIYLFSGKSDQTVTRAVMDQTLKFYQLAGVPPRQLVYVNGVNAGHAIITDKRSDQACQTTGPPFVNNCSFSQAGEILKHIYSRLNPPSARPSGKILHFDQRSFIRGSLSSMSDTAYAYVPQSCATETCRVHVAFHGCRQSAQAVGDHFYGKAGYNELADSNRIIVLYPQVEPSPVYPYNPRGCWDFWGYSSANPLFPDFYAKSAVQMSAVKAMLDRLAAPRR